MSYIDFKIKFSKFIIFSLLDIRKEEKDFSRYLLNRWQEKGYIKKVINRYYIFSDLEINEKVLFIIANKIYSPSYISLEMALSYYGLIPESVYSFTSVSTKKTQLIDTGIGNFSYRSIKPELMFGYILENYQEYNFKIADMEKTVLDYFYINSHLKNEDDFFELRFNVDEFKKKIDLKKFFNYLSVFNNKSLTKRINNFLKFCNIC